jgi:6,7-dimethyl-8-ribityllumazine synthase
MAKNGFKSSAQKWKLPSDCKVGVVCSRFNRDITAVLQAGALEVLKEQGLSGSQIVSVEVPGAIEIPVAAKALFQFKNVDAVIALGAVIRGETTHYESVCAAVERGCTLLALEQVKPVISGVLTVENEAQALARIGGDHGHKGKEAALTALEMIALLRELK